MAPSQQRGRAFFYVLFAALAIMTFVIIRPYVGAILVALVTIVLLKPLYDYLNRRKRLKGRTNLVTTITLLIFLAAIIVPVVLIGLLIFAQLSGVLESLSADDVRNAITSIAAALEDFLRTLPNLGDIEIDESQVAAVFQDAALAILSWLGNLAARLGTSLPNLFINAIIFLVLLATGLPAADQVNERIKNLSPLGIDISAIYLRKAEAMIVSVVKGVFLLAIIQGLIMGVFYWLAGVPFSMFWTILSIAFAVLPVVGISFIVLPMAIIALLTGNTVSAILLLIGFYVFVNPLDLVLRPRLVSKEAYLNFTLMLLALFGGLATGGLLGMIYGPVIMLLFLTTVEIYATYYATQDEKRPDEVEDSGGRSQEEMEITASESVTEDQVVSESERAAAGGTR